MKITDLTLVFNIINITLPFLYPAIQALTQQ